MSCLAIIRNDGNMVAMWAEICVEILGFVIFVKFREGWVKYRSECFKFTPGPNISYTFGGDRSAN